MKKQKIGILIVIYTINFENALINVTSSIFSGKRQIGRFYHYCRNIRKNSVKRQIKPKEDLDDKEFLNEIYSPHFRFNKENNLLRNKYNKLGEKNNE